MDTSECNSWLILMYISAHHAFTNCMSSGLAASNIINKISSTNGHTLK